jgi:hypothetical protein
MKLVAVGGWRYEPEWYVNDWIQNMLTFCDDVAIIDDRTSTVFWSSEKLYRIRQRNALIKKGATVALVSSPDERWPEQTGQLIRAEAEYLGSDPFILEFPLREQFAPETWRTDGAWGNKRRKRCFPMLDGQKFTQRKIQSSPVPTNKDYPIIYLPEAPFYHQKNIEEVSRVNRALAYEKTDPKYNLISRDSPSMQKMFGDSPNLFAEQGYHYLYDMSGYTEAVIPADNHYTPRYTRPYIWQPDWDLPTA